MVLNHGSSLSSLSKKMPRRKTDEAFGDFSVTIQLSECQELLLEHVLGNVGSDDLILDFAILEEKQEGN